MRRWQDYNQKDRCDFYGDSNQKDRHGKNLYHKGSSSWHKGENWKLFSWQPAGKPTPPCKDKPGGEDDQEEVPDPDPGVTVDTLASDESSRCFHHDIHYANLAKFTRAQLESRKDADATGALYQVTDDKAPKHKNDLDFMTEGSLEENIVSMSLGA